MNVIQIGAADGKTDAHRGTDEVWELVTQDGWNAVLLEPNPRHFKELETNYAEATYKGQVTLLEKAVAESDGSTTFFDNELFGASSLCVSVFKRNNYHGGKTKNYKTINVECVHINSLLQQYGAPDYLVMDVEGFDGFIIEMLDLERFDIPKIRFEFSHLERDESWQAQLGRVCLKLIKAGYKLSHDMADIVAEKTK